MNYDENYIRAYNRQRKIAVINALKNVGKGLGIVVLIIGLPMAAMSLLIYLLIVIPPFPFIVGVFILALGTVFGLFYCDEMTNYPNPSTKDNDECLDWPQEK